jgi:Spy/CpxP family protein refolding chaperone
MKLTYKIIAGAAAALSLALAGAVYAHPGGGMWGPGTGMGPGMGGMGPGMGMGPGVGRMGYGMGGGGMGDADMAAAAVGRAAELKYLLKVTPAQETAWKAFETAMVQQATTMQAMRTRMHAQMQNQAPGSAEWTAQRDALIKQHDASRSAHTAALKDLYAILTPEQRAIADRSVMGMGGPRAGGNFAPR